MKRRLLSIAIALFSATWVMAQSTLTDQQLVTFIMEENEKGTSQQEIITKLLQRGVDIQQIQRVKRKYERQIKQTGMGTVADEALNSPENRLRTNNGQQRRNTTGMPITDQKGSQMIRRGQLNNKSTYDENDPDYLQMQA